MRKFILIISITVFLFGQQEFAEPKPTFDNPRQWLVKVSSADVKKFSHTIAAMYNVLKEYPAETLNIKVLVYGPGMNVLKKDFDPYMSSRIKSLMEYDVQFVACKNTMETMGWTKKDLIDDLSYVQAGVAEAIESKFAGWIDVTPY